MPTYSYSCDDCGHSFELYFAIKDYDNKPLCTKCASKKTNREYIKDVSTQNMSVKKSDTELKTVGDLANRNRDKLSDDEKISLYQKHNSYKETESTKELPKGMSRIKKPPKIKWKKTI